MGRPIKLFRDEAELLVDLLTDHGDKSNHLVVVLIQDLCEQFGMTVPYRPHSGGEPMVNRLRER